VTTTSVENAHLSRRQRSKLDHDAARTEIKRLLAMRKYSDRPRLRKTMDVAKLLFLVIGTAAVIGKYSVTGVYDLLFESGQPVLVYGFEWVGLGLAVIWYARHRAQKNEGVSWGTVKFLATLFFVIAAVVFTIHGLRPDLRTNADLWHFICRNDTIRHVFLRDEPEGILGGLVGVFLGWNTLRRRSKHRWYNQWLDRIGWPNLENENLEVHSWHVWLMPLAVYLAGLPVAYGLWRLTLLGTAHQGGIQSVLNASTVLHPAGHAVLDKVLIAVAKFLAGFLLSWPLFLVGYVAARWWGRVPAFGVIDSYQEFMALRRIARRGDYGLYGRMTWRFFVIPRFEHGVLRWYQSTGYQLALLQEIEIGTKSTADEDVVAYAQRRLTEFDRGLIIPFMAITRLMFISVPVGAYFLMYVAKG
jgi:hypothetical protein